MDLSPRLVAIVDALPLRPGLRVLEIGCGPGAAAREVARRVGPEGFVLGVDRSARAIAIAERTAAAEISAGLLGFRCSPAEDLAPVPGEAPYDVVVAVRVGALDGRHPRAGEQILARLGALVSPGAHLYVDTGDPLTAIPLSTVPAPRSPSP